MKFSFPTLIKAIIVTAVSFTFLSCDDKALIQKDEDLSGQISNIKKQIEVMKSEAGEDPGDQSKMLEGVDRSLAELLADKKKLNKERQDLEESYSSLERQFLTYRENHPIKKKKIK